MSKKIYEQPFDIAETKPSTALQLMEDLRTAVIELQEEVSKQRDTLFIYEQFNSGSFDILTLINGKGTTGRIMVSCNIGDGRKVKVEFRNVDTVKDYWEREYFDITWAYFEGDEKLALNIVYRDGDNMRFDQKFYTKWESNNFDRLRFIGTGGNVVSIIVGYCKP
jgi:hypothetical protein